jgi:hypothetical protein
MTDRSFAEMANRPHMETAEPGGVWYEDANGIVHALPIGSEGQTLLVASGLPAWDDAMPSGHWEPVTNGDPDNPEIVFYNGDVVLTWVED